MSISSSNIEIMRTLLVLFVCIAFATAYDCFGRNNSCAMSHVKCDTGFDPFCEHFPGPMGMRVGICTCDKDCTSAADCSNAQADGCPPMAHPVCDTTHKVCHCFGPHCYLYTGSQLALTYTSSILYLDKGDLIAYGR